ncbi:MAG: PAAR domain-containing protein [Pantoea sp.]|uniref:PAAR domain-containing protein n=1 Tax=Pantoea sp. TaxID=69393 RepID=UPI0039E28DE8
MAKGIVLCQGDKTKCGGKITAGTAQGFSFGKPQAREGDPVTCGKNGKTYRIIGGISHYTSGPDNKRIAGSLDSHSSCPCKAKIIPSNLHPTYTQEDAPVMRGMDATKQVPAETATKPNQFIQNLVEQNRQLVISQQNVKPIPDGVYIWTEVIGAGHTFVSVHENDRIYLYTYGRFGRTGPGGFTGDGILNFLKDEDAEVYYKKELHRMNARVFRIDDADKRLIRTYFEDLWIKGNPAIQTEKMNETTKRRGRTIDEYDVTGNNCTTHSVSGIKLSGSKLFKSGYTSLTTHLPIEAEDDFTVPISLQRHLAKRAADMSSMSVMEMTKNFKTQYPNNDSIHPLEKYPGRMIDQVAAEIATTGNSLSPYSGGTIGGLLGGSYDINEQD